jgi:protoheme IX farnesyltransferase
MSLVIFTGLAGIVVAPGHVDPLTAFTALLCIAVGAGASGALNMAYDSDIDGACRARRRGPFPWATSRAAMRWLRLDAVGGSVAMMGCSSIPGGGLLAFTIFFYVGVYTLWLKRRTAQNIVIGGLAARCRRPSAGPR